MKKIFLILISLFLFACSNDTIIEEVLESYQDGSKKVVAYFKVDDDGNKLKIKETWFYNEGMVHLEGPIANNKRNGMFKSYYKSGEVMSEGEFVDGIRVGKAVTYHENGKVKYEGSYQNGKEVGIWKFYDEQGNLEYEINKDLR